MIKNIFLKTAAIALLLILILSVSCSNFLTDPILDPDTPHVPNYFITTWKTDNAGDSTDFQITIPTEVGSTYNYDVDWGDGSSDTGVTGNIIHTYGSIGTYTVKISGTFPRIYFNNNNDIAKDKDKILTIEHWGTNPWETMASAFRGCSNLTLNATDNPDLSGVTSMSQMFESAVSFNGDINSWDVSTITNLYSLFRGAVSFNQDLHSWDVSEVTNIGRIFDSTPFNGNISNWDVSKVTGMTGMFAFATAFNGDISGWDVSKVEDMNVVFKGATSFNQDISGWVVSSAIDMKNMFSGATVFNQDIRGWDVSKVTSMQLMFYGATSFNQNLSGWKTGNVTTMKDMFNGATSFNQDLSGWKVVSVTNHTDFATSWGGPGDGSYEPNWP